MRNNPQKHRLPPFQKNGVILVNKPAGWTSHDVVAFMRARFNIVKAGHCGTLDPAQCHRSAGEPVRARLGLESLRTTRRGSRRSDPLAGRGARSAAREELVPRGVSRLL